LFGPQCGDLFRRPLKKEGWQGAWNPGQGKKKKITTSTTEGKGRGNVEGHLLRQGRKKMFRTKRREPSAGRKEWYHPKGKGPPRVEKRV